LYFTGIVVDENNEPLSDIPLKIVVSDRSYGFSGFGSQVLAQGKTDENGDFSIISISPKGLVYLSLFVNEYNQVGHSSRHASYSVFNVETLKDDNQTLQLPELKVEKLINSELEIVRGNSLDTLFYEIGFEWREKTLFLNPDYTIPDWDVLSIETAPELKKFLNYARIFNPSLGVEFSF